MPDEPQVIGEKAGEETPQPEEPGAEVAETPTALMPPLGKMYSKEEVQQREAEITSKLQAEAARYRELADMLALQQQAAEARAKEEQFKTKDAHDVDQGILTQEEAAQRQATRAETAQLQRSAQYQKSQAEMVARVIVINQIVSDVQKESGLTLNIGDFLGDQNLRTPADVESKALKAVNEQLKMRLKAATIKPEAFDEGPGTGPVKVTGADRVIRGYAEGDSKITRADYERAMKEKGLL